MFVCFGILGLLPIQGLKPVWAIKFDPWHVRKSLTPIFFITVNAGQNNETP